MILCGAAVCRKSQVKAWHFRQTGTAVEVVCYISVDLLGYCRNFVCCSEIGTYDFSEKDLTIESKHDKMKEVEWRKA